MAKRTSFDYAVKMDNKDPNYRAAYNFLVGALEHIAQRIDAGGMGTAGRIRDAIAASERYGKLPKESD